MHTDELPADFARHWVEFVDPANDAQIVRADLTWLTSGWSCIFGDGCRGIDASRPAAGCCTLGAHFTEADDEARVAGFVAQLTDAQWQHRAEGLASGWAVDADSDQDDDQDAPARQTRTLPTGCIFLNGPDFAAGAGCALHLLALDQGREPLETKPDVCWQLPFRRQYRHGERADGTPTLEITIAEYTREGWGPGGVDLDWYCSTSPSAHAGSTALFISGRAELVELLGGPAYAELARHCERYLARQMPLHPATAVARG